MDEPNLGSLEANSLQREIYYRTRYKKSRTFKGPLRVVRLCLFGITLPFLLISLPLYLRYYVYSNQLYPFAVSDMRLLDKRISTIWCQKQVVKLNSTFNAFLLPETPQVLPPSKSLNMTRSLHLADDMKEYWGFYLLKGSSVTVSTCVRWPGSSLTVIRGHKHLHDCAYIGDDSSEELEELLEIARENGTILFFNKTSEESSSWPEMKRHRPDIRFHHPIHDGVQDAEKIHHSENDASEDDFDPKEMKLLLEKLSKYKAKIYTTDNKYSKIDITSSEEAFLEISERLEVMGENKKKRVLKKIRERHKREVIIKSIAQDLNPNEEENERNLAIEEGFIPDDFADVRGTINETTLNDRSNSEFWSSFSSSEEALLNCKGLILNLPLTPHHRCLKNEQEEILHDASLINTVTYIVPSEGYYFFVFGSENEVQVNYLRVRFELNRTTFNVSNAETSCKNATEECKMDLKFFSSQKIAMELPAVHNESRWNEEFIVVSECQPRTMVYVCFVLSVPIIILLFAFQ